MKLYAVIPWENVDGNRRILNLSLAMSFDHFLRSNCGGYALVSFEAPIPDNFLEYEIFARDEMAKYLSNDPNWIQE